MKKKRIMSLSFLYSEAHDNPELYEGLLHDYKENDESEDLPTKPLEVRTYYVYAVLNNNEYTTTHITEHPKVKQSIVMRNGKKFVQRALERKDNEYIFKVLVSIRWTNPHYELMFQAGDKVFHKTYFTLVD